MKILSILLVLVVLLLNVSAKSANAAETNQQSVAQSLDNKSDDIQKCAFENAPEIGNMQILANVMIDSTGKTIDVQVTVSGNNSSVLVKVKTCVESVIRGIKFPATSAPLTSIERSWTFTSAD